MQRDKLCTERSNAERQVTCRDKPYRDLGLAERAVMQRDK